MRPRMLCDPLGSSDWEQHIVQAKAGSVLIGSLGIIQGRSDWLWGGMTSAWHWSWEVQQQQWRVKETPLTTMQTEKEMSTNRLLCASIALQASDTQQVTQPTCYLLPTPPSPVCFNWKSTEHVGVTLCCLHIIHTGSSTVFQCAGCIKPALYLVVNVLYFS